MGYPDHEVYDMVANNDHYMLGFLVTFWKRAIQREDMESESQTQRGGLVHIVNPSMKRNTIHSSVTL